MPVAPSRRRNTTLIFSVLAAASPMLAVPQADASVRHMDLTYDSPGNTTRNRFDLYHSDAGIVPGMPTIIDLHGGGYTIGDKSYDQAVCRILADVGYTVCAMNYTLAAEDGTRSSFPQTFRDVRAMIRWVRTDGVQLGLSPTIIVIGYSAGGTIGLAAAYAPESPEFTPALPDPPGGYGVDATVGVFGRYDLVWNAQTYGSPPTIINYLATRITAPGGLELYTAAAARTYVQHCTPPTKLIVGDQDPLVPPGNSYRLAAALTDAGVTNQLQVVVGAGHGNMELGSPTFLANSITAALPTLLGGANTGCGAQPPLNDLCSDATAIFAEQSMVGTTVAARFDADSPCGFGDTRDVWFRFVPPANRRYTIDTFGTTGLRDTSISLFSSCEQGAPSIGCNDNAGDGSLSSLSVPLVAGVPVLIRVAGNRGSAGDFQINVDAGVSTSPPPVNDRCEDAVPLPTGVTLATTAGATGGSVSPCGVLDFTDVWFTFDAPATGSYRFETFGSLGLVDSTLALYTSCHDGECIGCNDDADDGGTYSRLGVALTAGQQVLVRVAGRALSEGSFVLTANPIASNDQGACCTGTACRVVIAAACAGSFIGDGTACDPIDNPITCCPANFNQTGGVSVQDVFDFLAAYFADLPSADFNRSSTTTVQDIFDFLSAYFVGCG